MFHKHCSAVEKRHFKTNCLDIELVEFYNDVWMNVFSLFIKEFLAKHCSCKMMKTSHASCVKSRQKIQDVKT